MGSKKDQCYKKPILRLKCCFIFKSVHVRNSVKCKCVCVCVFLSWWTELGSIGWASAVSSMGCTWPYHTELGWASTKYISFAEAQQSSSSAVRPRRLLCLPSVECGCSDSLGRASCFLLVLTCRVLVRILSIDTQLYAACVFRTDDIELARLYIVYVRSSANSCR